MRRAIKKNSITPTATVSNLGMIDLSELSCAEFQAQRCVFAPPGYDGVPLFLDLIGNPDGLELSARAPMALGSDGRLLALLEELGQILCER
jgi:hypothetical protein